MAETKLLRCLGAFAYMHGNTPDVIAGGAIVASDHPAVKGREDHFEPVTDETTAFRDPKAALTPASGVIESATAAPGEKRSVTKPRKRAAKKASGK